MINLDEYKRTYQIELDRDLNLKTIRIACEYRETSPYSGSITLEWVRRDDFGFDVAATSIEPFAWRWFRHFPELAFFLAQINEWRMGVDEVVRGLTRLGWIDVQGNQS